MFLVIVMSHFVIVASQIQQQSVCVQVESLHQAVCSGKASQIVPAVNQDKPGKRGPAGEKGDRGIPGLKGSVAEIDYVRVGEMISPKIEEALQNTNQLSNALTAVNEKIRQLENRAEYCPLRYNGKCFWIEVRYSGITCHDGQRICEANGGSRANVYSEDQYYMLLGYVRMTVSRDPYVQTSIGLTYDSQRNTVLLSNGTQAPFVKWYPGYPNRDCCCISLGVKRDAGSTHQHMFNDPPGHRLKGVICEK